MVDQSELELLYREMDSKLLAIGIDDAGVKSAMAKTLLDAAANASPGMPSPFPEAGIEVWQVALRIAEQSRMLARSQSDARLSVQETIRPDGLMEIDGKRIDRYTTYEQMRNMFPDADPYFHRVVDDLMRFGGRQGYNANVLHYVRQQYEAMRFGATGERLRTARALMKQLKELRPRLVFGEEQKGRLYEVELAPSEEAYLDWDKPLVEQMCADLLRDIAEQEGMQVNYRKRALHENRTGEDFYKALSAVLGSDESASKVLHSYGIPGIKYLDAASRKDGEGTHNHVIFDDSMVSIIQTLVTESRPFQPSPDIRYSFVSPDGENAFADASKDRLTKEIGFYGYPGGKSRGFITRMSVADFLELTTRDEAAETRIKGESGKFEPNRFDDESDFLPFLDIDPGTGQVLDHQGRHRAAALMQSGAVDLPVVIAVREPVAELSVGVLKGQRGRGAAVLGEIAALTKGNEAEAARVANATRRDVRPTPVFYSALLRAIEALPQQKADSTQWIGIVSNLTKKGVKEDEIEWSGVLDWLALQDGKITKSAVLDYLDQNGVKVTETILGADANAINDAVDRLEQAGYTVEEDGMFWGLYDERGGMVDLDTLPESLREDFMLVSRTDIGNEAGYGSARYGKYQLPGGENYRELLLTLPEAPQAKRQRFDVLNRNARMIVAKFDSQEEAQHFIDATGLPGKLEVVERNQTLDAPTTFRSSHFDERNILAHVRFNERTDAEGKRVLFLEELQSDWGQKGKKEGFAVKEHEYTVRANPSRGTWDVLDHNRQRLDSYSTQAEAQRVVDASKKQTTGVPSAPFVAKTEAWVGLVLKRMIRYAAENGFDRVAWTTGEQQAERYDLSKQVDSISWYKNPDDGTYSLDVYKNDKIVIAPSKLNAKGVADTVGKEVADKITSSIEDSGELSGIDLKVGGEGMQAFYDQIVPAVANDILKKLGGARVHPVPVAGVGDPTTANLNIATEQGREDVMVHWPLNEGEKFEIRGRDSGRLVGEASSYDEAHEIAHRARMPLSAQPGFDITPAIREKALSGLPLFMRGPGSPRFPGMTRDQLRAEIDRIFGFQFAQNLIDSGAFRILQRERELPPHLIHPRGGIAGVYDDITDKTYLVADWVRPDMVKGMILHEVGVHYGLRKIMGERADDLFAQARALVEKGDPAAVAAFAKVPPDTSASLVDEETLAYMVGDLANRKMPLVQTVVSRIKGFLFELGADIDLTAADMSVIAEGCVKRCSRLGQRPALSFVTDIVRTIKRSFALPDSMREKSAVRGMGMKYAFAGVVAQTGDRSLLAEAYALSQPLTEPQRSRYNALHRRCGSLTGDELEEYQRLAMRIDAQFEPDLIRQRTGWFCGYDDKWRFEIDDSQAQLLMPYKEWSRRTAEFFGEPKPYSEADGVGHYPRFRLDDVLDHPALFAAYPQLRSVNVFYDLSLSPLSGERGYFDPKKKEIGLGSWVTDEQALSSLMHEIQHAIQYIEGFARGGSVSEFTTESNAGEIFEEAQKVIAEIKKVRPDMVEAWEAVRNYKQLLAQIHGLSLFDETLRPVRDAERALFKRISAAERAEYDRLMSAYVETLDGSDEARRYTDALLAQYHAMQDCDGVGGVRHVTPMQQYQRLAGEIEARDVQARFGLPMGGADRASFVERSDISSVGEMGEAGVILQLKRAANLVGQQDAEADREREGGVGLGASRQSVPPYSSQGIPNEEVIVRFGQKLSLDDKRVAPSSPAEKCGIEPGQEQDGYEP